MINENFITENDVQEILKKIDEIFVEGTFELDSFRQISVSLNSFLQKLEKGMKDYEQEYISKSKKIESNSKIIEAVSLEKSGQNIIKILEQGYILLQSIREKMVGDVITYKYIQQYANKTVAYSMTLEQLLRYSRKNDLNTQSSSQKVADLSITMQGMIQNIEEELEQETLSDDPLYNSIMKRLGKVYERGKLQISRPSLLQEVYIQLKNSNFSNYNERKITRGTIYFYKMTRGQIQGFEGNLGQIKGGDSFLQQIKYGSTFRLIKSQYLKNQLNSLIDAFSAPFDKQQFYENMEKIFIQKIEPEIKHSTSDFSQEHLKKMIEMTDKEKAFLSNIVFNVQF